MEKQNNNFIEEVEKEFIELSKFFTDEERNVTGFVWTFISQKIQQAQLKAKEELKKEIIELARQYQEQIQGGGNGRIIFEQFISKIK